MNPETSPNDVSFDESGHIAYCLFVIRKPDTHIYSIFLIQLAYQLCLKYLTPSLFDQCPDFGHWLKFFIIAPHFGDQCFDSIIFDYHHVFV
jgi:hypothetical protein